MNYLIAAASSNSGKTTITMGLLRALHNRGLRIQPYKCGPDYIDPMFHALACGRESVNLDLFMSAPQHVKELFHTYSSDTDMSIVEGVMGMFDGYSKDLGSSAQIAKLLDIPVILIVNAKSTAYSVAPLIYGFCNFDKQVQIGGVIFNNVSSYKQFTFLSQACSDVGVQCLGYLPYDKTLTIPGRHLGLTIQTCEETETLIAKVSRLVEAHVQLEKIIDK